MSQKVTKAAANPYCIARKKAAEFNEKLKSREGAAEALGYAPSTMAGWELGTDNPSPEAVMLMQDVYNAPELKNYYCKHVCCLGCDEPEVSVCDLDRITVKALASMRKISNIKETLLDITEDGVISDDELPELKVILDNLDELTSVAQSLKIWVQKNMEE